MKSPDFEVKTTDSGDFNNHKTKYKALNPASYNFSGMTKYYTPRVQVVSTTLHG
jgi:hypothetical protein